MKLAIAQSLIWKLDVDDNPKTAEKYALSTIPTVIFSENGEPVQFSVGPMFQSKLAKELDLLLTD
jgi:thioredoxin 1